MADDKGMREIDRLISRSPCVVIITGKRGSGKTALGLRILEEIETPNKIVFGHSKQMEKYLPESFSVTNDFPFPADSAIFLDEAALHLFSRESQTSFSKSLNKIITISRQLNQTLIFATHNLRKLDVGVIIDADILVFREPSFLHMQFERDEIQHFTIAAFKRFQAIKKEERVRYAFFVTERGEEFKEIPLPSFWCEELSYPARMDLIADKMVYSGYLVYDGNDILMQYKTLAPALSYATNEAARLKRDIYVLSETEEYICTPSGDLLNERE